MVQSLVKSETSERQEVIHWLRANGYPALPVAPAQDATKYPKVVKAKPEDGVFAHCPLTDKLQPVQLYTGKNPSYLDQRGKPRLVNHGEYQNRLPGDRESKEWFSNPLNGVGTLGGWNNTIWLDFDAKQFPSQEECDVAVFGFLDYPGLKQSFIERTQSGGWRVGVRVKQKPNFTNFALSAGGKHIGEALGKGRFTVLAPTVGPSGNPYRSINRALPIEIESLESIHVFSTSSKCQHQGISPQPLLPLSYTPGTIPLEQLGHDASRDILRGAYPTGDRSEALATAIQEWFGWENWCQKNQINYSGSTEELALSAGTALEIERDRIARILNPKKAFSPSDCQPAALKRGGEESCWKKISRLDKASFEALCPPHIKDNIKAEWRRNSSGSGNSSRNGGSEGDRNSSKNGGTEGDRLEIEDESTEQNFWNAPVGWRGEIGWLIEEKKVVTEQDEEGNEFPVIGEDGEPVKEKVMKFYPKANFDFVVERELESDEGGGLGLLVKRSLDQEQKRVIISSQDYGSVKDFEAALKRVYKSGVVCNLKSEHLKSLIHVKLREYRNRGGLTYRLQDRAGQQADGHWVFKDCQITKDGVWSTEPNSDWVFDENLGGEDKMPQPRVAPPDPNALKSLVPAMRKFHGAEGIFPAMMALGFAAAAVHYQTIMKKERRFPQVNFYGDPGTNKTICAANGLSLVGWLNGDGMISGVSESKLYECLKRTGSLPLCLDDPPKSRELDEILKRLYNAVPRMVRGNYQEPHSPLMGASNHAMGDQQLATLTRMLQIPVHRQIDGDPNAWDEMQEAMEGASGCLPDLIKLGYPKDEIKKLEGELRSHLPKSHPRIASSMALILWYAMAVAKLADFDAESIKQYAIAQLCPIANAADTNSDSITDFLDKLSALKSESLVGEWNCQVVETQIGKTLAIQMSQVFPMIDRQFNPVYSRKMLEALIAKSGGTLQSVQKFHTNRDESLAYYRAKLTADAEPREPEYKPKRCVLLPFHLIKGFTDDWKSPTPPNDPMGEPVTSPVTSVTPGYTQLQEKCNQQNKYLESVSAVSDSPVTSFSEKSIGVKREAVEFITISSITEDLGQNQNSDTLMSEKDVTEGSLEPEVLTQISTERLHLFCNQTVTDCNQQEKNVTGEEAQLDAIAAPAELLVESEAAPKPSIAEMRSHLLACETIMDLTAINQGRHQTVARQAYSEMKLEEQLKIDALIAAVRPFPVLKFVGLTNQQGLNSGALVSLAGESSIQPNAVTALVKPLFGQEKIYSVVPSELIQVPATSSTPKALNPTTVVGGERCSTEELIARLAKVTTPEEFALATAGQSSEMVQDVIALQDTAAQRQRLQQFLE